MKPLLAKFIIKEHLISQSTGKDRYAVRFYVKLDNGQIEEIKLYTNSDYQDILSCGKIKDQKFFEPTPIVSWQKLLLECWNFRSEKYAATALYTFLETEKNKFIWAVDTVSQDELDQIFYIPESKSWCSLS